jgi:hypothetical protein
MHLGASNSLLTNLTPDAACVDPTMPSPVLVYLVECLREIISQNEKPEKPTLVLNGDILELALATDNIAAMAFERFAELILPQQSEPLFDNRIFYIPGNHDHHLWETVREAQYVRYLSGVNPAVPLPVPWHATNMFRPAPAVPSSLLEELIRRRAPSRAISVDTIYPNWGLLDGTGQRCVVFSHGHFTESMYLLMSTLRSMIFPSREMPRASWDYEAENFAWIDFFWSTMGRSGDVGTDMELVYDKLGNTRQTGILISNLVCGAVRRWGRGWPWWHPQWAVRYAARWALGQAVARERHRADDPLSTAGREGLKAYMQGPLREQILEERKHDMPLAVSFIYGHTHKPFVEDMQFYGYCGWTSVYNSGGWVVDTLTVSPPHGGAVILVDEDQNVVSLRMYNEAEDPGEYAVKVEAAAQSGGAANPLLARVQSLVDPNRNPWRGFSDTVAQERLFRVENLKMKIRFPD